MRKKQLVSLLLVLAMGASLCAGCGEKKGEDAGDALTANDTETSSGTEAAATSADSAIYEEELGEFYAAYQLADGASSDSERYALMALAEGKLLESGVMLPTNTRGGYYQLSNVAPYTIDWTLWGNDNYRFHQAIVATESIKAADRAEMKEKWAEVKGTGEYEAYVKKFLTDKGYKLKDSYTFSYNTDPVTWDVLATSLAADSEAIVNTYDGLLEYDVEGTLQPALAESYEVSDDGLTYTFHLRDDAVWTDSQGRELAKVTADDFVAGMQHMMDAQGGLEYLVQGVIVNADEYIQGKVTDFNEVGVKAVDEHTVEYTLVEPKSYFLTMLGYGVFAPMNRDFFVSNGGAFGGEYANASGSTDYKYGTDPDHIAYCGPYLVTNSTSKNSIIFEASDSYYNADKINVKKINWTYNDGSDPTKNYVDYKAGTVDVVTLNNSVLELAKTDGLFDDYAYVSLTEATSYMGFMNINRQAYANTNDETKAVSEQTDEDKERAHAAMRNDHFRRAVCFSVDRASYNAQSTGEDLKFNSLRNSYTPGNFVSLSEDVTVSINGTDTTFKAGTFYGEIVQAQIDADGVKMTAWDKNANDGVGSSDGFDGWYSPENAVAELDAAIEELAAEGVEVSDANPIKIDLPYESDVEIYSNRAQAFKQSVEKSLEGKVVINLVECATEDEWLYAGYYTSAGVEANYDIYDLSGWGPDYGDPSTYLDTMLPDYAGYMTRCLGIF